MSQIGKGPQMENVADRVVSALAGARKAAQLYPMAHPSYDEASRALVAVIAEVATTGDGMSLTLFKGRLYAGSKPLAEDTPAAVAMTDAMETRGIESLMFLSGFNSNDTDAVAALLNLRPTAEFDPAAELALRGATHVATSVVARASVNTREQRDQRREADRALYRSMLAKARSVSRQVAARDTPDVREATSMVAAVLSRLLEDEAAVLGLATIRAQGERELFHAVNVMIYSLALGRQLGLPEDELTELGVAALVHDIGKAQFDTATPQGLEAALVGHPAGGAAALSGLPDGERTPLLVAYEHHMGVDGSGWPARPTDYQPHPYSRIVAVGNRYDNLVKPIVDGEAPVAPERAVARLMAEGEGSLDPVFVRLFIRAIGVVPIGTAVRLSDDSVGIVCAVGRDVLTPTVRLVFDHVGSALAEPQDVDLQRDPRFIVEVLDPDALAIDPSEHL
jgi:HD-GYP domain-containing protein (c-di-GMP phosphodiesterase class II)